MKYFLSIPFTTRADSAGQVEPEYRHQVERLLAGLRALGHEVFCALEKENWSMGGLLTSPEEELAKDFKEIDGSDKLIILLDQSVSAGVQLENGYAYAKEKQFEIYQIGKAAWSNLAFAKLAGHELIEVSTDRQFVDEALKRNG